MKRKLSIASWALFIIITPLTFLGIIAQNTIPGDFLYSIKRTYEDGALLALSVFPSAKADYSTNLTSTRFTEAEKLITRKSDTQGLTALVTQIRQAKREIATVSDPKQKEELQQKLITSITQYQQGLNVVAEQVATQNSIAFVPTAINDAQPTQSTDYTPPTQKQTQQNIPSQNTQPPQQQPIAQSPPGKQQSPIRQAQQLPTPTPTQIQLTPTNSPTSGSGITATPTNIISSIQNTQTTLNTLKQQVLQSQMMIQTTTIPATSSTNKLNPTYHAPTSDVTPAELLHKSTGLKTPENEPKSKGD